MKLIKSTLAVLIGAAILTGCENTNEETKATESNTPVASNVKIATYNLSFDRSTLQDLVAEMQITPEEQQVLVTAYLDGSIDEADKDKAGKVIQIRNVSAVIQQNRPHVLMMAEFNNDGTGDNTLAIEGFQKHYLSVAQSSAGAGGEADLEPIEYPHFNSYATNTGLFSGLDLNNDGKAEAGPGDSWGFGFYHGQYAFALMSQYDIDESNTRTFQTFKWKDLEGASIPTITICDKPSKFPTGMNCGDEWYSQEEWQQVRLSSKNHVDAPIIIPTKDGEQKIHLLMSHPTPPAFDVGKNKAQNAAEVEFWHQYINGQTSIYDDAGVQGGLAQGANFVIMGDLNLDPITGNGDGAVMQALHDDALLNQDVTNGSLFPTSNGAKEFAKGYNRFEHTKTERLTAEFGLAVDYALPSSTLNIIDSGVYWPASDEAGYKLMKDERVGGGKGKDVSSDHRMIWVEAKF